MLYDVTLLNLSHVVYSYPSTIKDLLLHEQGRSVGRGSGQFGTLVLKRNAVREGTRPSLITAGLGKPSRVVSSLTVHSKPSTKRRSQEI